MLEYINSRLDDTVTDVFISARSGLWLHRDGHVERDRLVPQESEVRELASRLIDSAGRHIDAAQPCADAALPGGVRVHAVLAPVSVNGTEISLRFPRTLALSLDDFVGSGVLTPAQRSFLSQAVKHKKTFLVTGATGAGKTTLLAALMREVPDHERIVSVEDVAELAIVHPRVSSLETRQANVEGIGELGVRELLRQALRMRPDRLVVGECRGADVVDMLVAFTTGHPGGGSTLHALGVDQVPTRLVALAGLSGMPAVSSASLAVAAIDLIVHVEQLKGNRRISLGRFTLDNQGRLEIYPVAA